MREMLNLALSRMNPEGNAKERALAAKHYSKPFKKNCRVCGQQSHKAEDCCENEEISINVQQIGKAACQVKRQLIIRITQENRRNTMANVIIATRKDIKKLNAAPKSANKQISLKIIKST